MAGEGFEFSPMGFVPIGEGQRVWNEMKGGNAPEVAPSAIPEPAASMAHVEAALAGVPRRAEQHARRFAASPSSPRDVIRGARLRVKEIRAELRRLKALQRELAELERLLAAAKNKSPRATVRALDTARRTG